MSLSRVFYARLTLRVAEDILGKLLVHNTPDGEIVGKIVEAEAYIGETDPACHAAHGLTPRTAVMYGEPGHAYVYFTYGMHYMFNVVTERAGFPGAVLIRAIEPLRGLDIMAHHRPLATGPHHLTNGPGKLCQAFGIDWRLNGIDLCGAILFLEKAPGRTPPPAIRWTPRIGIRQGTDKLWRCYIEGNPYVTKHSFNRAR